MDNADPSAPIFTSFRPRPSSIVDSETEALSDLRTGPYFPNFKAPRRERILHPVITTAYDLEPVAQPEYHMRIHPALANADLRSRYLTDPEVHVPRPLLSSSNSRRSSTSISLNYRSSKGKSRSSTTGTSVAESFAPNSSLMAKAIMDEIDAEISIRLNDQGQPQKMEYETEAKGAWEDESEEKSDGSEAQEMQVPETRGLSLMSKPRISTAETEASSRVPVLRASHHEIAKVSISNLRELTVAEANARVQAFRASADYLSYQSEQNSIFENPRQANAAAKNRVAEYKRTPSWTCYAADVALILEHGDESDVAIISGSHSSRSSSNTPEAFGDGAVSGKPRQRYKGPVTQTWASIGANRTKEEMWD